MYVTMVCILSAVNFRIMFLMPLRTFSHDGRYYLCGNECSEAEVHKPPVPPGALTPGRLSTQKQLNDALLTPIQTLEMKNVEDQSARLNIMI